MAFFAVTIEEISNIFPHTDPEVTRLSLAQVKGMSFQFVIQKDKFKVGDKVVYFPIDSLFPESLLEKINLKGKLSGKNKNRLKSVSLRGAISQGLVILADELLSKEEQSLSPDEITSLLGITKYEPPLNITQDGTLTGLPQGYSIYDIEGADRNQDIIDEMMDMEVVVMEKMEGTNHSCGKNESGVFVSTRRNNIIEDQGINSYWEASRTSGLLEVVSNSPYKDISVYSEMVGSGIQGNIYELKNHQLFTFDIKVDFKWIDFKDFLNFCNEHNLQTAPILFQGKLKDYLDGDTVQNKSNGFSVVNPKGLREGIVIKPIIEQSHPKLGRLIIKQRSPKYLAGSDN